MPVLQRLWMMRKPICDRMAVAMVFPMFMMSVVIIRSVILFKRGAIRDKEVSFRLYGCCLCLCASNIGC